MKKGVEDVPADERQRPGVSELSAHGSRPVERGRTMKKEAKGKRDPDLLDDYDFSKGVRGKYAKRYAEGTNVVVLAPDVAAVFPDADSVNEALRALVRIARKSGKRTRPS